MFRHADRCCSNESSWSRGSKVFIVGNDTTNYRNGVMRMRRPERGLDSKVVCELVRFSATDCVSSHKLLEPRRVHENEFRALIRPVSEAMATDSKTIVEFTPFPGSDVHSRPRGERVLCELSKGGSAAVRVLAGVSTELHEVLGHLGMEPDLIIQVSRELLRVGCIRHPSSPPAHRGSGACGAGFLRAAG